MIDIRRALQENDDRFQGAIVFTYTLNLNFFEQLVAPTLYSAGCTNIVLLADLAGYEEATAQSLNTLTQIGTRYVCSPIVGPDAGVQHTKLILLIGEHQGRLLLGSGNLTLSGWGRNLELFHRFDLRIPSSDEPLTPAEQAPFLHTWRLVQTMRQAGQISSAAEERIDAMTEQATWLQHQLFNPNQSDFWHNWSQPLLPHFARLGPVEQLQIIAPFYDLETISELLRHTQATHLVIGIDSSTATLNGAELAHYCQQLSVHLEIRRIKAQTGARRMLHAKAYIGITANSAWCVSGSANCTRPALLHTWQEGGNLEYVVCRRATSPDAFAYLWSDDVEFTVEHPSTVVSTNPALAPGSALHLPPSIWLSDLTYQNHTLKGAIQATTPIPPQVVWQLQRIQHQQTLSLPVADLHFSLVLHEGLKAPEPVKVLGLLDDVVWCESPVRWVDNLEELRRFGRRTFTERVIVQLQTFEGAGKQFEELLNYLWGRVDPRKIHRADEEDAAVRRRFRGRNRQSSTDDTSPPPPASDFITDEVLVETISWRSGFYAPYDRSTLTLRDLLSLVLLRITMETTEIEDDEPDSEDSERATRQEQQELRQTDAIGQLCTYLKNYCKRYAARLVDQRFAATASPELILENHFTLCRVLLEIERKTKEFTRHDLCSCVQLLFGSIFSPALAGFPSHGAWHHWRQAGHSQEMLCSLWHKTHLTPMTLLVFGAAWGPPPSWQEAMNDEPKIRHYHKAKELLRQIARSLENKFWPPTDEHQIEPEELLGIQNLAELRGEVRPEIDIQTALSTCKRLAAYRTPFREKYRFLLALRKEYQANQKNSQRIQQLRRQIIHEGQQRELQLLDTVPNAVLAFLRGEETYCPRCHTTVPSACLAAVRRGEPMICPNCRRILLLWEPHLSGS